MATGHSSLGWLSCLCLLLAAPLQAVEVGIAGVFPNKALLVIDGAPPKGVAVGQKTEQGVKLVAVEDGAAIIEVDGKAAHPAGGPERRLPAIFRPHPPP